MDSFDHRDELISALSSTFGIDKATAERDIDALLAEFEQQGLFKHHPYVLERDDDDSWEISTTLQALSEPSHWEIARHYDIAGHICEFRTTDKSMGEEFVEIMSHLEMAEKKTARTILAVSASTEKDNKWDLFVDGWAHKTALPANELLPHIMTLTFVRTCESLDSQLLFHAAVAEKNGTAMIIPGEAGSGKSTLAAAMAASGFRLFSDELAVLDLTDRFVQPMPLPMSIKPGSVNVLEPLFPGLSDRKIHSRSDGKRVRYLSPFPKSTLSKGNDTAPVNVLLFPKFDTGGDNHLVSIDKIHTMERLAKTGSSNRVFTNQDVKAMIALVEACPCYEIIYSDVEKAVAQIKSTIYDNLE